MSSSFIALDLGGTAIKAALVTSTGEIQERVRRQTRAKEGRDAVLRSIEQTYDELAQKAGKKVPFGICLPGPLDSREGYVYTLPNLPGWEAFAFGPEIERRLKVPVIIENDANAAALGERTFGAGDHAEHMILLTVGTGIGSGIIVDGALLLGAGGLAGEAGHMTIVPDGHLCGCGNHGCLEAHASANASIREARRLMERGTVGSYLKKRLKPGQAPSGHDIIDGARHEDEVCLLAIQYISKNLGIGLAALVNVFNPKKVVIGGGFSSGFDLMERHLVDEVRTRAFQRQAEMVEILPASLGNDAGLLGMVAKLNERD